MRRLKTVLFYLFFGFIVIGCCGVAPKPADTAKEPKVAKAPATDTAPIEEAPKEPILDPPIWMTAEEVKSACSSHLSAATAIRDKLVAVTGVRSSDNTLKPVNDLLIELFAILPMSELIANVHPEESVRQAAETCQQEAAKLLTDFSLDRDIYDAVVAVDTSPLDDISKRFVSHLIRDYKLSGVDKDEATRNRLAAIRDKMVKTGQDFSRTIREDKRFIEVDEKATAGLPADFVLAHKTETGNYKFTTEYPDFMPVVNYADKEATRKALYIKFLTRGMPNNEEHLKELLTLRHEYATLLGYTDWADYNAQDKMAKNKTAIREFIDKVADIAKPRMADDLKSLLKRKKKDAPRSKTVKIWDRFYYANKIRAEKYDVDAKALRQYFEYSRVLQGILTLNEQLFQIKFEKVETPVWHEEVEAFNVIENGEIIGRFYLDMHPREGKYSHAAEFGMITGIPGRQLPSAALVCNFPRPSEGAPALMEHDQVLTVLHEFGHLMHQILAGRHPWVTLSGIACERDFVEVPSQILEHWGWSHDVLKTFALHVETGEPITKETVQKMNEADKFGRGAHVMRQMFYAGLSYAYHATNPKDIDLTEIVRQAQQKYSPYPYEEETHVYASFGHLESYSSMYYTYMWSLALSEDLFLRFKDEGLMNEKTALDFKHMILEPGGTIDAIDMVRTFLNRNHTFDALADYLNDK